MTVLNVQINISLTRDKYMGEVPIGETKEQKYPGFVISSEGDNMANIKAIKKKSIGVIQTIINK